jgi:hypothetical protein
MLSRAKCRCERPQSAGKKERESAEKGIGFEDEALRWEKWLKYWPVTQHREVKKIVRGYVG